MKIYPIYKFVTSRAKVLLLAGGLALPTGASGPAAAKAGIDMFLKNNPAETLVQVSKKATNIAKKISDYVIPNEGSRDSLLLSLAPKCDTILKGAKVKATIVVDVANRVLFKYNSSGVAEAVYPIAVGSSSTPTHKGLRIVSHIEIPYKRTAPPHTKRYKNPAPYGARCIILDKLDANTGARSSIGEFIHGNNNPKSIGKAVSGGCMRMDNNAVIQLSQQVKQGDIVIIK